MRTHREENTKRKNWIGNKITQLIKIENQNAILIIYRNRAGIVVVCMVEYRDFKNQGLLIFFKLLFLFTYFFLFKMDLPPGE